MANNYDFRNLDPVTGAQPEPLSPESLQINGEYLEQVIDGFATLNVTGRELLARETTTQKIGNNDGAMFIESTHPMRTISVTYQLRAATPKEFRAKFHKLSEKLDTPQSKIVFADQPELYFTGTMVSAGDVPEGQLEVTGTIEFQCTDPFAYATTKKTYQNTGDDKTVIQFENAGNYPAKVNVTAEMQSDNGFFAAALNGKPYQVGKPTQIDGTTADHSDKLVVKQLDPNKDGIVNMASMHTVPAEQGNVPKQGALSLHDTDPSVFDPMWVDSWGTLPTKQLPIQCTASFKLRKDIVAGDEGAKDFTLRGHMTLRDDTNPMSTGQLCMTANRADGTALASVLVRDFTVGREDYTVLGHINDQRVLKFKPSVEEFKATDKMRNSGIHYAIIKEGSQFTIWAHNYKQTFNFPALKDDRCAYVSFSFLAYSQNQRPAKCHLINWNFEEFFTHFFTDSPNYFNKGDILYYSSEEYKTYINDDLDGSLMDMGSRVLYAKPGDNQIGFVWSDWVPTAQAPKVTIEVQERWL